MPALQQEWPKKTSFIVETYCVVWGWSNNWSFSLQRNTALKDGSTPVALL
jgi:hypothetical protein